MIRLLLLVLFFFASTGHAIADQFDVILRYNNLAAARADADLEKLRDKTDDSITDAWDASAIVRVRVWRNSQDVTTVDAEGNPVVTHQYIGGVFFLVSLPRLVPALRDNPAVQIVLNRDKCNARVAGCVIRSGVGPAVLQDLRIEPVFAGADYPFGNMN